MKPRTYLLILSIVALLALLAGCGGGGGGGGPGRNTSVVGIVKDATKADAPLGGAIVQIGEVQATTVPEDDDPTTDTGTFRIEGAPVGATEAIVTPPGGVPQTLRFSPPLAEGANGPIELIANIGQAQGRILNPNGTPAAGAFVSILATGETTQTNAEGVFVFDAVPAGVTEIAAVLGTASLRAPVTIGVGLTNVGDLPLVDDPNPNPPGMPQTIAGTITLFDNSAPGAGGGATVRLIRNGQPYRETVTDANGGFGFYVPVGNYEIRVSKPGYREHIGQAPVTDPSVPFRADIALVR